MIAGAGEAVMGLAGIAGLMGLLILLVMAILMPYYVYKCRHLLQDLRIQADDQLAETKRTNQLLRQLIRAYGHDPEA